MIPDKRKAPAGTEADAETEADQVTEEYPTPETPGTPALDGMTTGKATGWPKEPDRTHYRHRVPS